MWEFSLADQKELRLILPTRGHPGRGRSHPRHVGRGRGGARVPRLQRGRVASRVGAAAAADAAVGRVELGAGVLGHERPVDGEHGELLEPLQQVKIMFGLIDLSHVE